MVVAVVGGGGAEGFVVDVVCDASPVEGTGGAIAGAGGGGAVAVAVAAVAPAA